MDSTNFVSDRFGRVVKISGRHGFHAFIPAPMPHELELAPATVLQLSEADNALGRLAGAGRHLPDPHVLASPYIVREAVASSRIEGTQASISDVFQVAVGAVPAHGDVLEVQNYVRAMGRGLARLKELPLCVRLLREIHEVLLEGVRGEERNRGEIRTTPNWIGSANHRPDNATFVPPPPEYVPDALADLEQFIHDDVALPVLIQCALLHYQFETIHPFLDGNGRLGRLLIVFFLVQQGRLPEPLLYVSSFFEAHRSQYYDRLQAVRERGEIQEWLQFFLYAVATQASDAVTRAESLADIRERHRKGLSRYRSRVHELVDVVMENPIISVRRVVDALGVTPQGALNLIRQMEAAGFIKHLAGGGRGTPHYWFAPDVYTALEVSSAADDAVADADTEQLIDTILGTHHGQ